MKLSLTPSGCRKLALAVALALPGLAAAQQGTPAAQALASFAAKAKAQSRLTAADVADPFVTSSYFDASTGLTHTYLQQRVNGLVVFNATGAVHTDASGKVVFFSQDFLPGAAALAPSPTPGVTPEKAVAAAATSLGLPRPAALQRVVEGRAADGIVFNNGGISEHTIPVRLMYVRVNDKLVLVWNVTIAQLDQQHHWSARIDAQTGQLIDKNDYVTSERTTFSQLTQRSQARQHKALAFGQAAAAAPAAVRGVLGTKAARSLTVVPVPFENPLLTPRVAVPLSSANPLYSPYGWQVGEGKAPSGFFDDSYSLLSSGKQLTRGNNVAAYDDNSNKGVGSLNSPNTSPDGGPNLDFDFPFDRAKGARDPGNLAAGITNLFYWNNMLHDIMMAHGFDEVSGNFQYKNLTGQGLGNDFVRAEAQSGGKRNNADFATPPDGSSGRMRMYLFDNTAANTLTVTGASSAAGVYKFASVNFGPSLTKKPLAGKLVLVNDGVSDDGGDHACATPFVNAADVAGNIAFIQRGGCPQLTTLNPRVNNQFAPKVTRAQANGAVGVIVFDSLATTNLVNFGGADTVGIRIPAIFISGADGFKLRAALRAGGTLNVAALLGPDFDGTFDNGVVSHEYGHGVSTRLTGGPANSSCLDNTTGNQSMGEGWSDYFALWMTTRPGDDGRTPRYVATYDNDNPYSVGPGFRSGPYTIDFSKNNYTYGKLGTAAGKFQETHDVGEVWTSVLWDMNWQFIYKYGYNADFFSPTSGGNNKALKLVLDGCKLQVCNPGFLDGRDAILRADSVTNRAANADLIWNVFARRGMGFSAVQGDRVNGTPRVTGIKEAFDLPPQVRVVLLATKNSTSVGGSVEAYPNPAHDVLTVRTQLASAAPMQVVVLDLLGKTVLPAATVSVAQMQQAGIKLNTGQLASGIYIVRVTTTEGNFTTKVAIER